jgi:hypothetical protein
MKHYGKLFSLIALLLLAVGLVLGFSGGTAAASRAPTGTAPRAGPLMTPSPSPTPGDPEWRILQ